MTLRDLERALLTELRQVTGRKRLRSKDIAIWNTSEAVVRKVFQDGDLVVHAPELGIWAIIPEEK